MTFARSNIRAPTTEPLSPVDTRISAATAAKLDEVLILLSQVNAAGLSAFMDDQKARLAGAYRRYAWSFVQLLVPTTPHGKHTLSLQVWGWPAWNNHILVSGSGLESLTPDAKTINYNFLLPVPQTVPPPPT